MDDVGKACTVEIAFLGLLKYESGSTLVDATKQSVNFGYQASFPLKKGMVV